MMHVAIVKQRLQMMVSFIYQYISGRSCNNSSNFVFGLKMMIMRVSISNATALYIYIYISINHNKIAPFLLNLYFRTNFCFL